MKLKCCICRCHMFGSEDNGLWLSTRKLAGALRCESSTPSGPRGSDEKVALPFAIGSAKWDCFPRCLIIGACLPITMTLLRAPRPPRCRLDCQYIQTRIQDSVSRAAVHSLRPGKAVTVSGFVATSQLSLGVVETLKPSQALECCPDRNSCLLERTI